MTKGDLLCFIGERPFGNDIVAASYVFMHGRAGKHFGNCSMKALKQRAAALND